MDEKSDFKGLDRSLRQQRVIDAAVQVFHQKGYRAATLEDVAGELGLTKAALYHYVSSKENLLSIIYLQALESFFAKAYEIGASALSPREKLRAFIRHHVKHVIIDNLAMFGVFFSEENELPAEDFEKIRQEKRKYTRVVETIFEEGMAAGQFRRADPWLQTCALLGACNWTYKWYKPGQSPQSPDDVADQFIAVLERGFLEGPGGAATVAAGGERRARTAEELAQHAREVARLAEELVGPTA